MKNKLIALLALTVTSSLSFGALYTVHSGSGATATGIQTLEGRTFRAGTTAGDAFSSGGGTSAGPGVIAFGIFSTDALSTMNQAQLIAAFTVFGSNAPFAVGGLSGNRSTYSLPMQAAVTGSVFNTKNMYVFAGNGTTYESSTQFLVVKSNYTFKAADDALPSPTVNVVDTTNTQILIGSLVTNVQTTNSDTTTNPGWQMATLVPETSTALLGALGALGLLRRRR